MHTGYRATKKQHASKVSVVEMKTFVGMVGLEPIEDKMID